MIPFRRVSTRQRLGVVCGALVVTAGAALLAVSVASPSPRAATPAKQPVGARVARVSATQGPAARSHSEFVDDSGAPACDPGTTVTIASGQVCGISQEGDYQWLGIPYAAPPVGGLRWQPPQPPAAWTTTLQATAFGDACVQAAIFIFTQPQSENCLFVNVVRPAGPQPSAGLPVIVHIHGGGFTTGNGNGDYSVLANTGNSVVVSMNYRLGIFGFLADPALGKDPGDYGLEDQQAALRWVQRNITAFGGDPRNVTIFGESAGGASVCDQIASPTARGLFEKGWSISGEYSTLFGSPNQGLNYQDCKSTPPNQQVATQAAQSFEAKVGCANAMSVSDCLRTVPADTVLTAAGGGFTAGGTGTISPTLNAKVLPLSLRQALVRGTVNRVDVVAGTERDEDLSGTATTADQYNTLVDQQFGKYAPAVLREYPLDRFNSPFIAFRTVAADAYTVCPAIGTEQLLAKRMPAWEYEDDGGDDPILVYVDPTKPNGNYHTGEDFMTLSGPGIDIPNPTLNPNQQVLEEQEVAELTSLAQTGNPTAPDTPQWPAFNRTDEVMSWVPGGDSQLMTTAQMSLDHHCGFWNGISPKQ